MKTQNRKYKGNITVIFFLIAATIYYISSALWGMTNNLRYLGIFIAIIQGCCSFLFKYYNKSLAFIKGKNIIYILILVCYLIIASIIISKDNEVIMSSRVWVQTSYILIPAIYAFLLCNLLNWNTIVSCVEYTLFLSVLLYIINVGPATFFSLSSWTSISFADSDSNFESASFSGIFTIAMFFLYRNNFVLKEDTLKDRMFFWISLIFAILAWKRLSVVFVLFLYFLGKFLNLNKKINKIVPIFTGIFFGLITEPYTFFLEGYYNPFNINVYQFTKGRDYILKLWSNYGYMSYGYGSSYELIHRYLELDLVQMYLEVGLFAVILFGLCYFSLVKNNLFAYVIMLYEFFNMLTASSIPSVFEWVLVIVLIVFSAEKEKIDEC